MKFQVLFSLLPTVQEKIANYRKRFTKYNYGQLFVHISDPYVIENTDKRTFQVVDVDVDGEYKIPGWKFIASLEWLPEANTNLVKSVEPACTVPVEYLSSTRCEHCHSNRERIYTVVIFNEETKEFKQVGRQCVKDYIGADVESYLSYLSLFTSMTDWLNSLPKEPKNSQDNLFKVDDVLAQTVEEVAHCGYVSQKTISNWFDTNGYDCEYCPLVKTSTNVYHIMNETTGEGSYELVRPAYAVTEDTIKKVEEIKSFVSQLEDTDEYTHNIKALLQTSYIDNKSLGLVVSSVGYYLRETAARAEAQKEAVSDYVGNIGEKIEFISKPTVVNTVETEFGVSRLYKFTDHGNVIMWSTGKYLDPDIEYKIKATIKEHSTFRSVKQTFVTRGKVLEETI